MRAASLLLAAVLGLAGCGHDDQPGSHAAPSSAAPAGAPRGVTLGDAAKGRQVWLAQCVSCHNAEPSKDGPVGPAVKGSSSELVAARVLHASYPPGYKPKRETRIMPPRPDLVAMIPDLSAYLR